MPTMFINAREVVGECVQRHFGRDIGQLLHQKVRRPQARPFQKEWKSPFDPDQAGKPLGSSGPWQAFAPSGSAYIGSTS
jgi:hypothetical protein